MKTNKRIQNEESSSQNSEDRGRAPEAPSAKVQAPTDGARKSPSTSEDDERETGDGTERAEGLKGGRAGASGADEVDEETGDEGQETEDDGLEQEHEQDHEHEDDAEEGYDYFDEEEQEAQWPESWRRPRRDSLAGLLEQDGMRQVEIWLRDEDRPYAEVKGLIKTEFGIETSEAALCRYYQQYLAPQVIARRLRESNRRWRDLPSESLENAVMARARQMGYDEMMKREPDVRRVERLLAMVNGMERRQLARERVKLERRRVEQREPERRTLAEHFALQRAYRDLDKRLDAGDPNLAEELAVKIAWLEDYKQQVRAEVQAARVEGRPVVLPEVPEEIAPEGLEEEGEGLEEECGNQEIRDGEGEAAERAEGLEGGRAEMEGADAPCAEHDDEHEQEHEQEHEAEDEARAGTQTDGARRSPSTSEAAEEHDHEHEQEHEAEDEGEREVESST